MWKALAPYVRPDLIVGVSAGALNGWALAGGATPEELAGVWLDGSLAAIRAFHPEGLHRQARAMASQFRPRMPFGLTIVEARRMRLRLVEGREVDWRHLAATCSIPFVFPSVEIDGRQYVDGGLLGALPVWAAEEMGVDRAIALNCLNRWPFGMLRSVLPLRQPSATFRVVTIEPSAKLGSIRQALVWSKPTIERWIALGERDGKAAIERVEWAASL